MMLSCSLDPDQDLQAGSKLVTWYDVCCNIRGGDYVLLVKFSGGDYVLVVKFSRGDYDLVVKFMGGDFVHVYKNEQGGFVRGGFCPTLRRITCVFTEYVKRLDDLKRRAGYAVSLFKRIYIFYFPRKLQPLYLEWSCFFFVFFTQILKVLFCSPKNKNF